MRSEQERLAAEAQREADTERDEMQRITLSATPTPSPYNPPPPVPPVTFSAMGDDGRFTVLLPLDTVRCLAMGAGCSTIELRDAARSALAAHDSDAAKEEWVAAVQERIEANGHLDRRDLDEFYDLAKGTEPTDG